jgi:hypothetical protein
VIGTPPSDQSLEHLTDFLSHGLYRRTDSPPVFEPCVRKEGCHARNGRTLALQIEGSAQCAESLETVALFCAATFRFGSVHSVNRAQQIRRDTFS